MGKEEFLVIYTSSNIDKNGMLFGKWKIKPDTWVITNRWQNFMYLLIGEEKALLIDSGYGEGNIREFVEQITDKPIMVLNTHGHFDHTGGNAWWTEAWMAESAVPIARKTFEPVHDEWFNAKPHTNYRENIVKDGDLIDLGKRKLDIIAIPAHNESSIAILDWQTRLLFVGDELESGQVLLFVRNKNISLHDVATAHKANMERLKARRSDYDALCPAHNGVMLDPDTYIDDYIKLAEELINGTANTMPNTAGFGFQPDVAEEGGFFAEFGRLERVQHGQASFIYIKDNK